jgi:hypothetical protein
LQSADADAIYAPNTVGAARHTSTERAHGSRGAQHILALQQARDVRASDGKAAQDEGAMRDRFVAGNAAPSAQRAGGSRR